MLRAEEVLELLEGPRKPQEGPKDLTRARVRAQSDGAEGWLVLKDHRGTTFAELSAKHYTCAQQTAITDSFDVKSGKVIRKLAVGEVFIITDEPKEVEGTGLTRVQAKAVKDNAEGWIAMKGNAGTIFAKASTKHYIVGRAAPLLKDKHDRGSQVRQLAADEVVELLAGPHSEKVEPAMRLRGRVLSDGAAGWVSLRANNLRVSTPFYKCVRAAPMHDARKAEGANIVRETAVDEILELLEGPFEEEAGGPMRVKARSEKDGSVGWASLTDEKGPLFAGL